MNVMSKAAVMVMALVSGVAMASDTSVTIIDRASITPVGVQPVVGYVAAEIAGAGSATVSIPNDTTESVKGYVATVRDSDGDEKNVKVTLSDGVFTIEDGVSGTLAASDTVNIMLIYGD